jgi:receptor expression-enhancing protein 5/6
LALAAVSSGILTLLGGSKLMVDLLGFVYPAYMSFKSMDSGSQDDTQWLTYWVVFSFLSIVENLMGFLVVLIPFYFWIKIGIIVWMWYPATRGAQVIYEQALRPLLLPYLEIDKPTSKKVE